MEVSDDGRMTFSARVLPTAGDHRLHFSIANHHQLAKASNLTASTTNIVLTEVHGGAGNTQT